MALGTRLRELRQEYGLSQARLANRAGLAERSYRRIEQRHTGVLNLDLYGGICYRAVKRVMT